MESVSTFFKEENDIFYKVGEKRGHEKGLEKGHKKGLETGLELGLEKGKTIFLFSALLAETSKIISERPVNIEF